MNCSKMPAGNLAEHPNIIFAMQPKAEMDMSMGKINMLICMGVNVEVFV